MMSKHYVKRAITRTEASCAQEAKRAAKVAYRSGQTINNFYEYPRFYEYLKRKKFQSNECIVRVYKDNIYIWRGKNHNLTTVHPIPDRFVKEMADLRGQYYDENQKQI